MVQILEANYEKADLPELIRTKCTNLSPSDHAKLLEVLTEFEDLFDGTLGDCDIEPVTFELKDGTKPYHGISFPIPQVHKETIMTEIKRPQKLGCSYYPQYGGL